MQGTVVPEDGILSQVMQYNSRAEGRRQAAYVLHWPCCKHVEAVIIARCKGQIRVLWMYREQLAEIEIPVHQRVLSRVSKY